jgi:hypothetical protein
MSDADTHEITIWVSVTLGRDRYGDPTVDRVTLDGHDIAHMLDDDDLQYLLESEVERLQVDLPPPADARLLALANGEIARQLAEARAEIAAFTEFHRGKVDGLNAEIERLRRTLGKAADRAAAEVSDG